jgi:hypothetical protein
MKLTTSANLIAKIWNGHRKNRNPHDTGLTFGKVKRWNNCRDAIADNPIHSCDTCKSQMWRFSLDFYHNDILKRYVVIRIRSYATSWVIVRNELYRIPSESCFILNNEINNTEFQFLLTGDLSFWKVVIYWSSVKGWKVEELTLHGQV